MMMNTSKLRAIIEVLRTVPDEQFNMGHWWLKDGIAFDDDANRSYKVSDGPCGCAIGHAVHKGVLLVDLIEGRMCGDAFAEIAKELGVSDKKARFMFSQYDYPGPIESIRKEDVIRRIESVLSESEL